MDGSMYRRLDGMLAGEEDRAGVEDGVEGYEGGRGEQVA